MSSSKPSQKDLSAASGGASSSARGGNGCDPGAENACKKLQAQLKRAAPPSAPPVHASAADRQAYGKALAAWRAKSSTKALQTEAESLSKMLSKALADVRKAAKSLEAKARLVNFFEAAVKSSRSQDLSRCPICFEDIALNERAMLPCAHVGCVSCFEEVTRRDGRCPVCRSDVSLRQVLHLEVPENLGCGPAAECGRYGSKIMRLLNFLSDLHAREPEAKVILFVQWEDLKKKVASALQEFEVRHSVLQGSVWARQRAIERFQFGQSDEGCNLLLLSLQDSASGTNLTAASHVILFHPVVAGSREASVACEMQAIGRALRAGQEREVHIWRFVVVGTTEQKVTEEHQKDLWQRFRAEVSASSSSSLPS